MTSSTLNCHFCFIIMNHGFHVLLGCFDITALKRKSLLTKRPHTQHTHTRLPSKCSEGRTGVRRPGDDEQQDDDERNLGHLPFAPHLVEPLRRVSRSITVDLRYRSVRHKYTPMKPLFVFSFNCICNFR